MILRRYLWVASVVSLLACDSKNGDAETGNVVANDSDAAVPRATQPNPPGSAETETESTTLPIPSVAAPEPPQGAPTTVVTASTSDDSASSPPDDSSDFDSSDELSTSDISTDTASDFVGETLVTSPSEEDTAGPVPSASDAPCTDCDAGSVPVRGHGACAGMTCGEPCNSCETDDANCQDDGLSFCDAQGECSSRTFLDCPRPLDEACKPPDVAAGSLCAATEYTDTANACAQHSWMWNGCECIPTTHCGCAAGDCDRLHNDSAACESAHAECLPNACQAQDAQANGNQCGAVFGYAFTGYGCDVIMCGCNGDDCADVSTTMQECQERWQVCMGRVPECAEERFPLLTGDDGVTPENPEYTFSVEGYAELYDSETQSVAVFADWTEAQWLGWDEASSEPVACPAITGFGQWNCPQQRPLMLQVGDESYRVNISLPWDFPLFGIVSPTQVDVKIGAHASGTLVLQIRDQQDGLPVLMVAQTLPEVSSQSAAWEFAPFTFAPSGKFCATEPDDCNTSFAALGLQMSNATETWIAEPLSYQFIKAEGKNYTLYHGYLFEQFPGWEEACVTRQAPRQTFALVRAGNGG